MDSVEKRDGAEFRIRSDAALDGSEFARDVGDADSTAVWAPYRMVLALATKLVIIDRNILLASSSVY